MGHGRVSVGVVGVLLAFPALAMGDGSVTYDAGTHRIEYEDFNDTVDNFTIEPLVDPAAPTQPNYGLRWIDGRTINAIAACVDPAATDDQVLCGQDPQVTFVIDLDGGDDRVGIFPFASSPPLSDRPSVISGGDGNDVIDGGDAADTITGDAGNDTIVMRAGPGFADGGAGDDVFQLPSGPVELHGGSGRDRVEFTAAGSGEITLDGVANDPNGSNVRADIEDVTGDGGDDRITGSGAANRLFGAGGDDLLVGGAGPDVLDGGADDDTVQARDGEVDSVVCGGGVDQVFADWNDAVDATCEPALVSRSVRDDDADGSPHDQDCNDADPGIRPGVNDVPTNGIDEDCSGADLDADGDGIIAPADCDDRNAAIKPGVRDVPRNGINEDCRGGDADYRINRTRVAHSWIAFTDHTEVAVLRLRLLPARARIQVRCTNRGRGCPFTSRRLRGRSGRANAAPLFRGAELDPGAVIEIRVTARDTMGRVFRYTMRSRKLPARRELCLTPGRSRPGRC